MFLMTYMAYGILVFTEYASIRAVGPHADKSGQVKLEYYTSPS